MQIIPADPVAPWRYVDLTVGQVDVDEQVEEVCAAERAAVCDLAERAGVSGGVDPHRRKPAPVCATNHHIVMDGWSLPIVLQEIFASYFGQRLPAAAPYRSFVSWLAGRDRDAARAAWREVLAGFDTPTLVVPPDRLGLGNARCCLTSAAERDHTSANRTGALSSDHGQHSAAGRVRAVVELVDRSA